MKAEQLPLMSSAEPRKSGDRWTVPVAQVPGEPLTAESSLGLALHWFAQELERLGYAENTRKTYTKAVSLLARYLGRSRSLSEINPDDLHRFQAWVEERAGSPKTAEVKLTAVRRFFLALYEAEVLPVNVAGDMYPTKAVSPLPVILNPAQADTVRRIAAEQAESSEDPDPLPALLITLLLDMGLRLGEALDLHPDDVDLTNPLRPVIHIRYDDHRHRAKRRALVAPPALATLAKRQRERLTPQEDQLLDSSRRALQYTVERVGDAAGLRRTLTPSTLRWTYAVDQFRTGLDPDVLRQRLGLSERSWKDTEPRLRKLAQRPL